MPSAFSRPPSVLGPGVPGWPSCGECLGFPYGRNPRLRDSSGVASSVDVGQLGDVRVRHVLSHASSRQTAGHGVGTDGEGGLRCCGEQSPGAGAIMERASPVRPNIACRGSCGLGWEDGAGRLVAVDDEAELGHDRSPIDST